MYVVSAFRRTDVLTAADISDAGGRLRPAGHQPSLVFFRFRRE